MSKIITLVFASLVFALAGCSGVAVEGPTDDGDSVSVGGSAGVAGSPSGDGGPGYVCTSKLNTAQFRLDVEGWTPEQRDEIEAGIRDQALALGIGECHNTVDAIERVDGVPEVPCFTVFPIPRGQWTGPANVLLDLDPSKAGQIDRSCDKVTFHNTTQLRQNAQRLASDVFEGTYPGGE